MAERIEVDRLGVVAWLREWRSPSAVARLGQTADGRWVADHSRRGTLVFWTERGACDRLDQYLARGVWREIATETTAV